MAHLGQAFDPSSVPDVQLIPPNTFFLAQIIASELKATKAGTGQLIVLTWEIVGGPFAKKQVFQNINWRNENPSAQEIGHRELKKIMKALRLDNRPLADTRELHMIPCKVRFKTEESAGFAPKSVPVAYEPMDGAAPSPAPAPSAPAAPQGRAAAPAHSDADSPWG